MVPHSFVGRLSIWMAMNPEVVVVTMEHMVDEARHIQGGFDGTIQIAVVARRIVIL
jgi:hypothetical protein